MGISGGRKSAGSVLSLVGTPRVVPSSLPACAPRASLQGLSTHQRGGAQRNGDGRGASTHWHGVFRVSLHPSQLTTDLSCPRTRYEGKTAFQCQLDIDGRRRIVRRCPRRVVDVARRPVATNVPWYYHAPTAVLVHVSTQGPYSLLSPRPY